MLSKNQSLSKIFLQLRQLVFVATLIFFGSGQADDTDIYMGGGSADSDANNPNVLFILDTSGSMNARDAGANKRTPRMTVLKEAMDDLLTNVDNVNVGLSRFSNSGGSVLFPITPIDGNANNVVGESKTAEALNFTSVLVNPEDDAEERVSGTSTGQVFLHDDVLEAFDFGGTSGQSGSQTIEVSLNNDDISEFNNGGRMLNTTFAYIHQVVSLGLRFQGVNIAKGTTIQSAFIDFTHRIRRTNRTNAVISGLDIANTPVFSTSSRDLSSRSTTSSTVAWDGIPGGRTNTKFTTPDVKSIVQEIVDRDDWTSGNSMGFKIFTSRGTRYPYSRNASSTRQPKLRIKIQATAGAEGDDQLIALRFEDVRIPRGATLQEAKLLVTNSAAGGSNSVVWQMSAEQVDDSPELTSTSGSLSNRKGGGTVVNWTVDNTTLNVEPATCGTGCTEQRTKPTNDIKSIIHEVTNRSGWCGGNAITIFIDANSPTSNQMRKLHSRDSSEAALAPKLVYSYMPQSGCMNSSEVAQIASSSDDAEQFSDSYYGSRVNTVSDDLILGEDSRNGSQTVGLRFRSLDIPKQSTIKSAHIEFRAKGTSSGAASYTIKGINADNVGAFRNSKDNVSGQQQTTASTVWDMSGSNAEDGWDDPGAEHTTEDLSSIVQEIVNRPGWSKKSNMGFVITGTGTRSAESFDSDPSKAPRLVVKYDDSVTVAFKSVREVLKEKVKELPARGGTPIAGALVESAKYFRGDRMRHGQFRGTFGQISHPGSYCKGPGNCPGATATSGGGGYYGRGGTTDEFFVLNPNGCTSNNLGSFRCRNRKINGNPTYISPIQSGAECATNHQVLLTDGQAFGQDHSSIKTLLSQNSGQRLKKSSDGKPKPQGNNCYTDNSNFKKAEHDSHSYVGSGGGYYGYGSSNRPTDEACVPDLVELMANADQNRDIEGVQTVKTHTVAFALKAAGPVQFLKDVANVGGGNFYSADTAGDLQDVFKTIFSSVRNSPTSFAAPSLATNAFNKLLSRDEVYFGMFTPELSQRWHGNVKKYNICLDQADCTKGKVGDVIDVNKNSIIGPDQRFSKTAKSHWGDNIDGDEMFKGGTGAQANDHEEVLLLTDMNNATSSPNDSNGVLLGTESGYQLTESNWKNTELETMRNKICSGVPAAERTVDGKDCEKRMLWLLGKQNQTEAESEHNSDERWSVADVLHSSPSIITYHASESAGGSTFVDKVIYGTNAGMLHMINGKTGAEEWRYLPSDFWGMQQQMFDNRQDRHVYGIDATPTLWVCDKNDDGKIQADGDRNITSLGDKTCGAAAKDFVRAIVATRRGGGEDGFIYAIDLSKTINDNQGKVLPKFMWRIRSGDTDFRRLAQTWSEPTLTTIMVNKGTGAFAKDVLVFGGGFDPKLDESSENLYTTSENDNNDYLGNAIYIVDPMNGKKILSISGLGSDADIKVTDMNFSIPSKISILDSNSDGLTDRLYFGDTGGQVWRIDLAKVVPMTGDRAEGTFIGKLADISDTDKKNRRRFFEPPSIVQVTDTSGFSQSEEYDLVLMGTGNRPDPLAETVHDNFYGFRDTLIGANELGDGDGDHVSGDGDGYPNTDDKPFTHENLVNVTQKGLGELDKDAVAKANGYFFSFAEANSGRAGEKMLSRPLTAAGSVVFTTFDPVAQKNQNQTQNTTQNQTNQGNQTAAQAKGNDPCSAAPNIGTARAYHMDILTAEPPEISEVAKGRGARRFRSEIGSGIPSDVIPVFTGNGVVGLAQADGVGKNLGQLSQQAPERAYWNESIEF